MTYRAILLLTVVDREEAKKEEDFSITGDYDDEDEEEEWEGDSGWTNEDGDEVGDVKDESAAYLEFLNEEVSHGVR